MLQVLRTVDNFVVLVAVGWSTIMVVVAHPAWRSHIVGISRPGIGVVNHKLAVAHLVNVRALRVMRSTITRSAIMRVISRSSLCRVEVV